MPALSSPSGVDVVIPNFNGHHFLSTCLQSLQNQTYRHFTVYVVDNGSTDGSVAYLNQEFPAVQLIALPENTGFSAAVNRGIEAGHQPLVFLLNNDTELEQDCLQRLASTAEQQPHFAYFAAKMLSFHEREFLDGAGEGYLRGGAGYRLGTLERDGRNYDLPRRVFGACGGAALYRRSLFAEIGLFDEDFFAYLEDVDFNLRANRARQCCFFVPSARVYHIGSATSGSKFNPLTIRLSTRNSLYVLAKHYSLTLFIRYAPVVLCYQLLWLLFTLKKKQFAAYLVGLGQGIGGWRSMRRKYKARTGLARLSEKEFRQLLQVAEQDALTSITRRREAVGKGNLLLDLYRGLFL